MTGRERMARAMRPRAHECPDRVPVMCQLALGHYFLNAGLDAIDIWQDSAAFAEALVQLQRRYRFDGILVNLPGRDPARREFVTEVQPHGNARHIVWKTGHVTIAPPDDNPRVLPPGASRPVLVPFSEVEPDQLFHVEPHDLLGTTRLPAFPPWHWQTLEFVREMAPDVSVHGEVFSPFSQMLELLGCTGGLFAMMREPEKFVACLERLTTGAIELGCGHFAAGADAVLISSAYAGATFLSRAHYSEFVLPFERTLVSGLKSRFPARPVYTHTCGAIGDRLDLMEATGTDGIDTLDPPPLGTTDLADAKRLIGDRVFIKGNVNPVDTVLRGTSEVCYRDACDRVAIGKPGGGYILGTACSVPPHAAPENILALTRAAEDVGWY